MKKHIRKDKNNNTIIAKIQIDKLLNDWVNCKLYKIETLYIFGFKLNYNTEVYNFNKPLSDLYNWDCIDVEYWVDNCIVEYNNILSLRELKKKTKLLIENHC